MTHMLCYYDSTSSFLQFLGLLGAVTYEHAADRIDPYIHNLWNPQHSGVHYAIVRSFFLYLIYFLSLFFSFLFSPFPPH